MHGARASSFEKMKLWKLWTDSPFNRSRLTGAILRRRRTASSVNEEQVSAKERTSETSVR